MDPTALLNPSLPFDQNKVQLLDQLVSVFYGPNSPQRPIADKMLNEFKAAPDSWVYTDLIMEHSANPNSKFLALSILEEAINTRWKILPEGQRLGIREYIWKKVLEFGKAPNIDPSLRHIVSKLNSTLVAIVKQEWCTTWRSFIPELCSYSKTDQNLCETGMSILKQLSEEIFDFSKASMTSARTKELKAAMNAEFGAIFDLCDFVLDMFVANPSSIKPSLVKMTLKTFGAFMSWIPLGYIFETPITAKLIQNLLQESVYRVETIKCLTEVAGLRGQAPLEKAYEEYALMMFIQIVEKMETIIQGIMLDVEYHRISVKHQSGYENFCLQFGLLLTTFIQNHIDLIEAMTSNPGANPDAVNMLIAKTKQALIYILQLSNIPNDEIFKMCAEFWNFLANRVYTITANESLGPASGLLLSHSSRNYIASLITEQIFPAVMENHITKMPRPKEVLVIQDESGNVIQEPYKDTESISLYETMKRTLICLAILDGKTMTQIILKILGQISEDRFPTFDPLNRLCWAIGAIHDSMGQDAERYYLMQVIKELLSLCERKRGKDNKAIVASNIMYVVGQYPAFLKSNWKFLKTVVKKLNEFMHEKHPGVQDMACETYLVIAKECKEEFSKQHNEEPPYIDTIINMLQGEIKDLEPHQKHMVYQSIGWMIKAIPVRSHKEICLHRLMDYENNIWDNILMMANNTGPDYLKNSTTVRQVDFFVRVNEAVATSVGDVYSSYLQKVYLQMLNIYKFYSETISGQIQVLGPAASSDNLTKTLKVLRKNILRLFGIFMKSATDLALVATQFAPPLQELMSDYEKGLPDARDPEVVLLFSTMVECLGNNVVSGVEVILSKLGTCTLEMIGSDYLSYPEHRLNYFLLLKNIVQYCFQSLFMLHPEQFKIVINSILWAIKHQEPNIAEIGLNTLMNLITNLSPNKEALNQFYAAYLMQICRDIFIVLTDSLHKSGFKLQAEILRRLILAIESKEFITPISPECPDNKHYVREYLISALTTSFPNTSKSSVTNFVDSMFASCGSWEPFKTAVRDFLVTMKEFAEDSELLYSEERQKQEEEARRMEEMKKQAVLAKVQQEAPKK